jgi:hypothetical protein
MSSKVDVHIGLSGAEPQAWLDRCLRSLEGQPVNIRFVDAVPGDVGSMRANGYALGTSGLVSYVDPDDWVEPWTYAWAVEQMRAPEVSACYVNHGLYEECGAVRTRLWFDQLAPDVGFAKCKQMHHGVVHRREVIGGVLPLLRGVTLREWQYANLQALKAGKVVGTLREGYGWRVTPGGAHKVRPILPPPTASERWKAEMQRILLAS